MQLFSADQVHSSLGYRPLIEALRKAFSRPVTVPPRQHLSIESGSNPGTLLLMPCWEADAYLALKVVSIFGNNPKRGLPTVIGTVLLFNGTTGEVLAAMDGSAVTVRRTAATSALAADYLSRHDARTLLVVGAGALAPHLVRAHACVRTLDRIWLWNRTAEKADRLAECLQAENLPARAVRHLKNSVSRADIISCATSSREPLVLGDWIAAGTHLDLVGSYTAEMSEVDARAVVQAEVFVDTREGALNEAGDLIQPLRRGLWDEEAIRGDLHEIVSRNLHRSRNDARTLFKSVGVALEDLVAARLVYETRNGDS